MARAPLIARGEAKASGTLSQTPLVHLLIYAADNKLQGTLLLTHVGERSAIVFVAGRPSKTQTPKHPTMKMADIGREDLVKQHMVDDIGYMMSLPGTVSYAFYDGRDMLSGQPPQCALRGDPLPLVMMGVRKYLDYDTFDQVLPRVANTELRLHERASPARLGLRPEERKVLMLLRQRAMTLNDMLADEDVDEDAAQRTIYALIITRQIATGAEKRSPVAFER